MKGAITKPIRSSWQNPVRSVLLLFTVVLLAVFTSCRSAERAWATAQEENSIAAYEEFLADFGDSDLAPAAREKLHDAEWADTDEIGSRAEYEAFLEKYPSGRFSPAARDAIEGYDWREADQANTLAAYNAYLDKYPTGSHAETAERKIAALSPIRGKLSIAMGGLGMGILGGGTTRFLLQTSRHTFQLDFSNETKIIGLEKTPNGIVWKLGDLYDVTGPRRHGSKVGNVQETIQATRIEYVGPSK